MYLTYAYFFSFMTNLDRIASSDYVPTDQDVLRVRFRSTAVTEHSFIIEKITLRYSNKNTSCCLDGGHLLST